MSEAVRTNPQDWGARRTPGSPPPAPGVLLVYAAGRPSFAPLPFTDGRLEIGRGELGPVVLEDSVVSKRHARISLKDGAWLVEDLGSRNGTVVDGRHLTQPHRGPLPRVVRIGDSLFVPVEDVRPYLGGTVHRSGKMVRGPKLERAWHVLARAAGGGDSVHIVGESGSGKELAAQAFHQLGPRKDGPFVAVNCASIQPGVAERLLFGAKRGAYSGAVDADGYLQAAHGGTLFLDEIAELETAVQAKLLRTLETGEVLPVGAARPRTVDVRVVSATHKVLRAEVGAGRFREDLYYRVGRPEVVLPPLRERAEEIPWLVELALDGRPHDPSLVEECLLRRWPGNVRELITEVRAAARDAEAAGVERPSSEHLSVTAGLELSGSAPGEVRPRTPEPPSKQSIEQALAEANGNVSAAARALGMHRTQLRRWLAKHQIGANELDTGDTDDEE